MARPRCPRCERPLATCLCALLPARVHNPVELLILQHPAERQHAKGTAVLLALGLSRVQIRRGEVFAPDGVPSLLLYPGAGSVALRPAERPERPERPERLILLDGSWRQSRALLHSNPWLVALPRLPLVDPPAGRYDLRRAHTPQQLSTLEAGVHALAQLEGDPARYQPLLDAFEGFVAEGLRRAGRA